ncbi:MAG: hypothetical protein ACRYFK_09395 [Janthinobacterium lividum]
MPLASLAQSPAPAWGGGVALGNGLEAHVGAQRQGWLLLGRARYRWWGPRSGPGASWLDDRNTSSRQVELAALGGYGLPLKQGLLYGGLGLGYLNGRQLGDYRYAIAQNSLLGTSTYYFAYRNYQALGLPVELGVLTGPRYGGRLGLAFQANFNPEKTLYCGLLTLWLGRFGQAPGR